MSYAASPYPVPPPAPPTARTKGVPLWVWVIVAAVALPFGACGVGLTYIGLVGPDTKAQPGAQVPSRFISTMRDEGLLGKDEHVRYFYSDALTDIRNGMYFVTDRKVVAYNREWEPPAVITPYEDVQSVDLVRSSGWPDDSVVNLVRRDGSEVSLLVAPEANGDERFLRALKAAWRARVPAAERSSPAGSSPTEPSE